MSIFHPKTHTKIRDERELRRLTCVRVELSRTHYFAGILLSGRMIEMDCCKR